MTSSLPAPGPSSEGVLIERKTVLVEDRDKEVEPEVCCIYLLASPARQDPAAVTVDCNLGCFILAEHHEGVQVWQNTSACWRGGRAGDEV